MKPVPRDLEDHTDLHDPQDLLPHLELEADPDVESDEHDSLSHTEQQGVDDADELLLSQIEDHGADLGLDVETGVDGGLDASSLVDDDDERLARDDVRLDHSLDDGFSSDATGIDGGGAEDGWTTDSEGDSEPYQADFDEDETSHRDDGGLEGVESSRGKEDLLHEGLDENALPPLHSEEGDDALVDEIERELLRELSQGI